MKLRKSTLSVTCRAMTFNRVSLPAADPEAETTERRRKEKAKTERL